MDGRHLNFNFNLEDLKSEQVDIDKLIDGLLNNNSATTSSSGSTLQQRRGSEVATTPISGPVRGRGPGRPRTSRVPNPRPPTSPAPVLSENSPLSAIIECLNKINTQNKRLLDIVEGISDKVESGSVLDSESNGTMSEAVRGSEVSGLFTNVNSRLDKIEQNINQTTLICRGPAVESLIKDSSSGEKPDLERLRGEICEKACGEEVENFNISGVKVSVFGKAKKCVRVECQSLASKIHLIKKTRLRKPQGFYVNEFLTESKLKIFHSLRSLKKLHPQKIKSVFSRGGNVFYSLYDTDRFYQVSSVNDLNNLQGLDAWGTTTPAA